MGASLGFCGGRRVERGAYAIAAILTDIDELNFCHPETGDRLVYSLV